MRPATRPFLLATPLACLIEGVLNHGVEADAS